MTNQTKFCNKWLIVLLLLFIGCAVDPKSDDEVLAAASGQNLNLNDYIQKYEDFLFMTGAEDNLMFRNAFLSGEIDQIILLHYADTSGFSQLDSVRNSVENIMGQTILNRFYARELNDEYEVPDITLREAFRRSKIEVHARHLFSRTIEEANELKTRLNNGETFEDIAQSIFQDPQLAETGGDLGFFSYDDMEPAFEDAAYSLKDGEISEPVKIRNGYSIIQVIERIYEPIITEQDYLLHKDDFEMIERKRQMKQIVEDYTNSIADQMNLQLSEEHQNLLWDHLDEIFTKNIGEAILIPELQSINLRTDRYKWELPGIVKRLHQTRKIQRDQIKSVNDLFQVLSGLVVREEIFHRARQTGWYSSPEFQNELTEAKNQKIIKLLVQSINEDASNDNDFENLKERYLDFIKNLKTKTNVFINSELLEKFVL